MMDTFLWTPTKALVCTKKCFENADFSFLENEDALSNIIFT